MIRHIVLLKLKEETTVEALENIKTVLATMPSKISEIAGYSFGQDLAVSDNTADLAIVADFDGVEEFKAYSKHPHHVDAVKNVIKPHVIQKTAMQIEL